MIRNIYVFRKFSEIRYTVAIVDSDRYSCNNLSSHDGVPMTTLLTMPTSYIGQTVSKKKIVRAKRFHGRRFHTTFRHAYPMLVLSTSEFAFYHVRS